MCLPRPTLQPLWPNHGTMTDHYVCSPAQPRSQGHRRFGRRLVSGILWIDMPSMHSVRVAGSDVHHGANPAREPEPAYEITCVCLLNDV